MDCLASIGGYAKARPVKGTAFTFQEKRYVFQPLPSGSVRENRVHFPPAIMGSIAHSRTVLYTVLKVADPGTYEVRPEHWQQTLMYDRTAQDVGEAKGGSGQRKWTCAQAYLNGQLLRRGNRVRLAAGLYSFLIPMTWLGSHLSPPAPHLVSVDGDKVAAATQPAAGTQKAGTKPEVVEKGRPGPVRTPARSGAAIVVGGDTDDLRALYREGYAVVCGHVAEKGDVDKMRRSFLAEGLSGPVSVVPIRRGRLPYIDNLVDLVVIYKPDLVPLAEALRVVRPGGKVRTRHGDAWKETAKPVPAETDEWTHHRYDAGGSLCSSDARVGPPTGVQWISGPGWEHYRIVSAKGRVFRVGHFSQAGYVGRGGMTHVYLLAQNAYNGQMLWLRSPQQAVGLRAMYIPVVAEGDRVFALWPTEKGMAVVAFDGATGRPVHTYGDIVEEHRFDFVVEDYHLITSDGRCFDAGTGRRIWRKADVRTPSGGTVLAADGVAVCELQGGGVLGIDLKTGGTLWREAGVREALACRDGILITRRPLVQTGGKAIIRKSRKEPPMEIVALSLRTGKEKWRIPAPKGQLHFGRGHWWFGCREVDPSTGETLGEAAPPPFGGRCVKPYKATARFRTDFANYTDFDTGILRGVPHLRFSCHVGSVPANGLVYFNAGHCNCYDFINFNRTVCARSRDLAWDKQDPIDTAGRLEKGPAYAETTDDGRRTTAPGESHDWSTYRHDAQRTGRAAGTLSERLVEQWATEVVPPDSRQLWERQFEQHMPPLTAPVVAGGRLFVAAPASHVVHALDAKSGKKLWTFITGGAIDHPPTIVRASDPNASGTDTRNLKPGTYLCLFGCRDGWVYCLRAKQGDLVWRFRAAPIDNRVLVHGRLESEWPVHGSVLVHDGLAFAVAGWHTGFDGGLRVCAINPMTGDLKWESRTPRQAGPMGRSASGFRVGFLTAQGTGHVRLGPYAFETRTGKRLHAKQILGADTAQVVVCGRQVTDTPRNVPIRFLPAQPLLGPRRGRRTGGFLAVADDKRHYAAEPHEIFAAPRGGPPGNLPRIRLGNKIFVHAKAVWRHRTGAPYQKGLLLAGNRLYAAVERGRLGGVRCELLVLDAESGKKVKNIPLDTPPVFDGLIAANGRLYMSTEEGSVRCLGTP